MGKQKRHITALSNDERDKVKNNPYLSESIANDLMFMYSREPEWTQELEETIGKVIKKLEKTGVDVNDYVIRDIHVYYPVKCNTVCVEDYDYKKLIDTELENFYTEVMLTEGDEIADITYIKCIFKCKTSDNTTAAIILTKYIEYEIGQDGKLEDHSHFTLKKYN